MHPDLAALVGPRLSRAEAIRAGLLVDVTRAASWVGFQVPASMTVAAWEEIVGADRHPTAREREAAGRRLHSVWAAAAKAVAQYRSVGEVARGVRFTHAAANPGHPRPVRLQLHAGVEDGAMFVTVALEGET